MNYKGTTYKKIIVVGSAGSGKSYLSKQIAEYTKQPLIHLDNEYWKPGWTATPKTEWVDRQKTLISGESWIIDGNYKSTLELRFEAADCVVFLDINRYLCIYGVWKRHGKKRTDLPEYLDEKKDKEFFEFIKWVWNFPKKDRKIILQLHNQYPEKQFIVITNRKEMKNLLKDL
ncbi:MAG TPA: topology modulation protein [Mobilitalea sp.]|nr:topology modulation protein [Mobilitalea sp.]